MTPKLRRFLDEVRPSTPYLVVDVDVVEANYRALAGGARRRADLLRRQGQPGARDPGSAGRTRQRLRRREPRPRSSWCWRPAPSPERISYGNTIKKEADIARAFARGRAPVRLRQRGRAREDRPRRTGRQRLLPHPDQRARVPTGRCRKQVRLHARHGARPAGPRRRPRRRCPGACRSTSARSRSDPTAWDAALAEAAGLFRDLEAVGVELGMVNLGGGFPTPYRSAVPDAAAYGAAIMAAVAAPFRQPAAVPDRRARPRPGRRCRA